MPPASAVFEQRYENPESGAQNPERRRGRGGGSCRSVRERATARELDVRSITPHFHQRRSAVPHTDRTNGARQTTLHASVLLTLLLSSTVLLLHLRHLRALRSLDRLRATCSTLRCSEVESLHCAERFTCHAVLLLSSWTPRLDATPREARCYPVRDVTGCTLQLSRAPSAQDTLPCGMNVVENPAGMQAYRFFSPLRGATCRACSSRVK